MSDLPPSFASTAEASAAASRRALDGVVVTASLADLGIGDYATIHSVRSSAADAELVRRLIEIGFVPGERVRLIAAGRPGREPLAVRLAAVASGRRGVNGATFALRRHEADFVRVVPDAPAVRPPA